MQSLYGKRRLARAAHTQTTGRAMAQTSRCNPRLLGDLVAVSGFPQGGPQGAHPGICFHLTAYRRVRAHLGEEDRIPAVLQQPLLVSQANARLDVGHIERAEAVQELHRSEMLSIFAHHKAHLNMVSTSWHMEDFTEKGVNDWIQRSLY